MIDTRVTIASIELGAPVMTASGTAGYGTELAGHLDLASLGAMVTKSLAAFEWPGNPAPRLHPTPQGIMNAVGLQGPGVQYWLDHVVGDLVATGATVVASIWGRSVDDYAQAADLLAAAPPEVIAVEVNLSCPNLKVAGRSSLTMRRCRRRCSGQLLVVGGRGGPSSARTPTGSSTSRQPSWGLERKR